MVELGVDALVVTTHFYALSNAAEIEAHFGAVKETTGVDLFAYDVPVRTHAKLPLDVAIRLAEDGVIIGVKDSSGDDVGCRRRGGPRTGQRRFRRASEDVRCCDGRGLAGRPRRAGPTGPLFEIAFTPDSNRVSGEASGLGSFKTTLVLLGAIETKTMSVPMASLNDDESQAIAAILRETGLL